jgi:hypothetical protein
LAACPIAAECETLDCELKESRQACSELQAERDDLAAQLAATEAELQNAQDNIEHLRWGTVLREGRWIAVSGEARIVGLLLWL